MERDLLGNRQVASVQPGRVREGTVPQNKAQQDHKQVVTQCSQSTWRIPVAPDKDPHSQSYGWHDAWSSLTANEERSMEHSCVFRCVYHLWEGPAAGLAQKLCETGRVGGTAGHSGIGLSLWP